ncbi:MAG: glycerate kinase [Rhizobiales bacterium]|nr:glycerate kinase [Hyphomicrobiales bacterium]
MFDAAVARAQPAICLPPHFPPPPPRGRLLILACGKSGAHMAEACEHHYLGGGLVDPERLVGICVTRHGHGRPLQRIRLVEAGHPVPDAAGLNGTADVLALARDAGPDDLVLVLISGGGSANWTAPAESLDIADKQALTRKLLASGAPISDINVVRKHLSRIKGGRLAALLHPAPSLTLCISDVPTDDPSLIASGPTAPDPTTADDAIAVLRRWRIDVPAHVEAVLAGPAGETPKPGDPVFADAELRIVGRPADSLAAAAKLGRAAGYEVAELGDTLEGEASALGAAHGAMARDARRAGRRVLFLSGGELTVTVRGDGRGGPNQEYALALALGVDGEPGISALAADTDGADGGGGAPDDPAGAFADGTTLARARALGLNAAAFLANNDATGFFAALGDLLITGPTGTNVNDFRCVVVDRQNRNSDKICGIGPHEPRGEG